MKFLGALLLVAGTTIGAGMLALPVVTGLAGFYPSLLVFVVCWLFMLFTAYLFLEINLWLSGDANLISMARVTLGRAGAWITWILYLLLLYSLMAAYIAGGGAILIGAIDKNLSHWFEPLPMLIIFGLFIYVGTRAVDILNRLLMIGLVVSFVGLIAIACPHVQPQLLQTTNSSAMGVGITVVFTSYGFHIVIPSLTQYLKRNVKQLRWAIFLGSAIPFVVYVIWQYVILGIVPAETLADSLAHGESATQPLSQLVNSPSIATFSSLFSFFAIITSFIGVAMSLSHFLHDGLKISSHRMGKLLIWLITFIPPVIFVLFYPRGFIAALQYAGIWVALLLGLLPIAMVWKGRYTYRFPKEQRTFGGKPLLIIAALFYLGILIIQYKGL